MKQFLCFFIIALIITFPAISQEADLRDPYFRAEDEGSLSIDLEIEQPRLPLIRLPENSRVESLEFDIGINLGTKNDSIWNEENVRMDFKTRHFTLIADLSMNNDQKYAPVRAMLPSGNFLGFYFFMNEGGLSFNVADFSLTAGRFRIYDVINSPYAVFINSRGNSANTLAFKYDGPHFMYQTQWIDLNSRNATSSPAWDDYHRRLELGAEYLPINYDKTAYPDYNPNYKPLSIGFPDRGANYKAYALKVNSWRLGFLDAAVYTGRSFDPEYFLNPLPQYFIQYVKGTPGRPWTTDSNENNMFGFFYDIKPNRIWNAYAQVLIDDFSLGFMKFLYDGFSNNPWKLAWALGGTYQTPYGRFGFHTGGALKYTFAPIGSPEEERHNGNDARTAYGYTYYPETRYNDDESGTGRLVSILIEDNMIGYKNGENNLSFQVDYQNRFRKFLVNTALEVSLTGNSSPANPWHEYTRQGQTGGTHFLDDGNIETKLELRGNVSRKFGPWTFFAAAAIGGKFNRLQLTQPWADMTGDTHAGVADTIWIWKPSHTHELILRFTIGGKYTLGVL